MVEFLSSPPAQVIVFVAITFSLLAVGIYVIGKVRGSMRAKDASTSDMLTNFHDLNSQGELSDEEYRTIKAMLAERMQNELKSTEEPR